MRDKNSTDNPGVIVVNSPFLSPKFKSTPNCPVPEFAACQLARTIKWIPGVINQASVPEK